MSRIGKLPIEIPQGVQVTVSEKNLVTVKGPLGELSEQISPEISVNIEESEMTVTRPSDNKTHRSLHGLSRTLIANMIVGVTKGYEKKLKIIGVGYRATKRKELGSSIRIFTSSSNGRSRWNHCRVSFTN